MVILASTGTAEKRDEPPCETRAVGCAAPATRSLDDVEGDPAGRAERLRELVLELEKSRNKEAELRGRTDALLGGLQALSCATDTDDAFRRLLDALRPVLEFDDALILVEADPEASKIDGPKPLSGARLRVATATDPELAARDWRAKGSIERCFAGRTVTVLDTQDATEWAHLADYEPCAGGSAILAPLIGRVRKAALVCLKAQPKFFQKRHARLVERMAPLARQALIGLEQREALADSLARIRGLIDNAPYAVLTIGGDMHIEAQHSSSFTHVTNIEGPIAGRPALPALREALGFDDGAADQVRSALEVMIGDNDLSWTLNVAHLPGEATIETDHGPRVLDLIWSPLFDGDGDTVRAAMLSVRDVTSERAMAAQLAAQNELHARVMNALDLLLRAPRARLSTFFVENDARIEALQTALASACGDANSEARTKIKFEAHTLKGGARLIGLAAMAAAVHALEDCLKHTSSDACVLDDEAAQSAWEAARESYEFHRAVYYDTLASDGGTNSALVGATLSTMIEPHLADARTVLAKKGVRLCTTIDDAAGTLEPRICPPLETVFQHLLVNVVDHSIKPSLAERPDPKKARVTASATLDEDGAIEIRIEDDGVGFVLEKILAVAEKRGAPVDPADPLSVIFSQGFSTAAETTDRSGRGVGMSAVAAAVVEAGGAIRVENRAEGGGRTIVTFPAAPTEPAA